jgi:LacI family transcriptional regulator
LKKNTNNKVGIKDIAERANVSIGTVDRVLHNRGEVSESTRKQVLSIVEELSYTPNLLAKSLSSKKKYSIAILIPDYKNNNPYWKKPLAGINLAAKEIQHYNFELKIFTFELGNEKSLIEKSEQVFKSKPSGLIFSPVMYKASQNVIKKCDKLKIPYVFFDVNFENCNNLAYFGQNSEQSGYVAARLLDHGLAPNAELFILKLVNKAASTYHVQLRENGFQSYFSSKETHMNISSTNSMKNNITRVPDGLRNKNFSEEKIKNRKIKSIEIDISVKDELKVALDKIFKNKSATKGLFVTNSRVYNVAKYIYEKKIKNVILIGYDLIDENLKYLNNDTIQFLICQNPEDQGYNSVMALFNFLLMKKPIEKFNFSPIDIIIKENLLYYKSLKL